MTDLLSLRNRAAVVTGGGRGLGLAIARRLGVQGAHVYIAEIDIWRGKGAAERLTAEGLSASFVHMDVSSQGSVETAIAEVEAERGVYALINNAGLADGVGGRMFYDIPVQDWDRIMAVNARGPWLVARAVAQHMIAAGDGRIVNVSSDAALYGSPRLAHYISSKAALIGMTRAMARDLGEHGITVNAVAPGLTISESAASVPEERHELYRANRALPRDQQPEDVAGAIAFLVGSDASYITGQLLVVDGGFVFH